ncbi:uncharacterized protein C2845_PM03G18480 [Panicum miliaceum]|uniref:Uncharacterized protein n=1 Tax=Panicum miliaceum TaxID=4540 RepID=A0A3L6TBU5_PANMI|nr:uncharacterized protein C2845_PM03G18480 [Panicum miliaceum]
MAKDAGRPEELLNSYLKLRMATGNIASGLGVLALLWSTVVLLGGLVSDLPMRQFWIITVISFVMACKMVDISENEITKGIYLEEAKIIRMLRRQKWIEAGFMKWIFKTMLGMMYVPKVILFFCLGSVFQYSSYLSLWFSAEFLLQRDYGDTGVDIDKRTKLRAALCIFYGLVLLQSLAVIYWMYLVFTLVWAIEQVASTTNKQCGFEGWGSKVVRMYALETIRKFRKDWVLPDNWNLITYAVGLLQSASVGDDHLWGARVLDTFFGIGKDDLSVRQELLSSKSSVQNLITMIVGRGGTADSIESRERAARIVAQHLASHLHVTQFPGTLQCICSLLDPQDVTRPSAKPEESLPVPDQEDDQNRPLETVVPIRDQINAGEQVITSSSVGLVANRKRTSLRGWIKKYCEAVRQRRKAVQEKKRFLDPKYRHPYESRGAKELISQGLLILERLTLDKVNCTETSRHQVLLCMITSPLSSSHDLLNNVQDGTMVDMVSKSLTVLSRLLTSPGDGATRLRQELASNTEAVSNLMRILESDREGAQQLHEQALEILTELGFDDSFTKPGSGVSGCMLNKLFKILKSIFLEEQHGDTVVAEADREKAIRLRGKAGEALARLLAVHAARGVNVAHILSKQEAINLLNKVLDQIKSSKMGTSPDAATGAGPSSSHGGAENVAGSQTPEEAGSVQPHTQGNEKQSDERRFVAAMLSLAVAIRDTTVMSKQDFAGAIHEEDAALVKKLAEILKVSKHSNAECLRVVKLTCQVVIAMIQDEPSCIQRFNEHSFKEALTEALETMVEVDGCVLFAGNDRREVTKPARSLASLVKERLETAQEQGN